MTLLEESYWFGGCLGVDLDYSGGADGSFAGSDTYLGASNDGGSYVWPEPIWVLEDPTVSLIGTALRWLLGAANVYGAGELVIKAYVATGGPTPGIAGPNGSEMDNGGTSYGIGTWNTFGSVGGDGP